jgi:Asp-tRNA(Asn)/Glu-tRNA(Gln) amidotransferase A subunit family amidase
MHSIDLCTLITKPNNIMYDLCSIDSPRMSGALLRLLVFLLESPLSRSILSGTLTKSAGIDRLRKMNLHQPPSYYPIHLHSYGGASWIEPKLERPVYRQCGFKPATILDYAEGYRSGKFTPEIVAISILESIESMDQGVRPLRAFSAIHPDDLLQQARLSTQRFQEGRALGVIDGVPIGIKDEFDMMGYGTTVGTKFLGKKPSVQDATTVAKLRSQGALLPGKTNMHEIGIGVTGLNVHHGTTRNPYSPDRHTGGSSSGSAAAVAAGLVPAAIGADAGGSIRIPASFCGVVGLKPTFGRVSEHGAAPLCWSMGHIGPIAASAADAALIYAAIAGPDPLDTNSLYQPLFQNVDFETNILSGLRLGVYPPWFQHAHPDIVTACSKLLEEFRQRGAEIVEVTIPGLDAARIAHLITVVTEMQANVNPYRKRDFSAETRAILALASTLTGRDYTTAQQVRTHIISVFKQVLDDVDMVITPTTAITAPLIHDDALAFGEYNPNVTSQAMRFVFASNLTGLPAITFPAGYDSLGMPIGMQAIGRAWEEHRLLALASASEEIVPRRSPEIHRIFAKSSDLT